MRGGERCLEAVCELFPDADIFTLIHISGSVTDTIESHKITTSYIQKLPGKNFRHHLPLFPHAIQQFDLSGYDFVISFSHCVAKGVNVPKDVPHLCYCYTPMRYAWYMRDEYLSTFNFITKRLAQMMLDFLRAWDRKSSTRVTHFIAISQNVRNRIKHAYNRDSMIIFPPVDCDRFVVSNRDEGYYLVVSALVPYKRNDIAVKALSSMPDRKLVVVGNGPQLNNIKSMAKANVTFVETASDEEVAEYMKGCKALLFPGEEDFGIVPLEVQACGKPVITYGRGGALETVVGLDESRPEQADATGVFFHEQNPEALREAILFFEKNRSKINPAKCRDNAMKFSRPLYKQSMQKYIQEVLEEI